MTVTYILTTLLSYVVAGGGYAAYQAGQNILSYYFTLPSYVKILDAEIQALLY